MTTMKTFVIERDLPGAGALDDAALAEIAATSNTTAESLGVPYRWITSYAAGDKVYCVHQADSEATIREHSRRAGFPCTTVTEVGAEFGPRTAP
ncbi:nickel-binding protein [Tsukamurella sp. NPDC003166]|uniref:nickel-binding protein n=1 Tax=Tsukamurella sp. NPDC003166 TaxID=3154444 RepID=UPI0033B750E5